MNTGNSKERLQQKINERKNINREISDMQYESLVLQRTVDILQNRLQSFHQYVTEQEEQGNVKGFHRVQEEILEVEQHEAAIDEKKGQTLQEISDMITKMTEKLKIERERLHPLVSFMFVQCVIVTTILIYNSLRF